jgi:ABC-type branched-subunit amino acid transport system substrate-binding protein
MSRDRDGSRRRDVLKGLGAASLIALAGCSGGGDGGDGDDTPTDAPTETATMTETMTETATETMADTETPTETEMTTDGGGGATERTLRLGILMGVTGGLAELGPPIRNAAQACANYVDENSDTFTIDQQFADTATDPNTGISQAQSLVNQGYPMVAGALSSTVTIQTARNVFINNEVVQCSPASTSPAITDLDDNDFVYRTTPTDALQAEVMVNVAQDRLEGQSTAYMALNNDYGQGLAQAYADAWESAGGTVQAEVSFEPGQSSYSSRLAQALGSQPDVLMIVGYPESGVQIFRDFYSDYSQDFCDIIVPDGLKSESLPGNVGNSMRNVWGTAPLAVGPSTDFFTSEYESQYGNQPATPFMEQSWDAAAVLMLANAAAGENSGPAIRDEMLNVANGPGTEVTAENLPEGLEMAASGEEINYQGASGAITFDDAGDVAAATYELYRYMEGGLETVEEIEYSA